MQQKLKRKLKQKKKTVNWLSEKLGIHRTTVYRKMKGELQWTVAEVNCIAVALELSEDEMNMIFFDDTVA